MTMLFFVYQRALAIKRWRQCQRALRWTGSTRSSKREMKKIVFPWNLNYFDWQEGSPGLVPPPCRSTWQAHTRRRSRSKRLSQPKKRVKTTKRMTILVLVAVKEKVTAGLAMKSPTTMSSPEIGLLAKQTWKQVTDVFQWLKDPFIKWDHTWAFFCSFILQALQVTVVFHEMI